MGQSVGENAKDKGENANLKTDASLAFIIEPENIWKLRGHHRSDGVNSCIDHYASHRFLRADDHWTSLLDLSTRAIRCKRRA